MKFLYLDIDSLRPDHLGCYGYGRNTSPNIDRIASEGLRLENCYASDMPCMPSRTSLFSGQLGIHHGCVAHTGSRAEPYLEGPARPFRSRWAGRSWMRQLQNAGYKTATFSSFAERHAAWHWYAGFQEIYDPGQFGHESAHHVVPGVLDWLSRQSASSDWFLHVNLWDVHVPYRTPEDFGNLFSEEPLAENWFTQELLDMHQGQTGIRSAGDALFLNYAETRPELNPAQLARMADYKKMVDSYDTAIRYVDDQIGSILGALELNGVLEETAIIITADHGECLGELNAYGGHCFADYSTARVPMIIRWPGVTDQQAGQCDSRLHYSLDLPVSINQRIGAEIPVEWDGMAMDCLLQDEAGVPRDYLVVSQLAQTVQRSVLFTEGETLFEYIRSYRKGFYDIPDHMLFNLSQDPHQLHDLSDENERLVQRGKVLLQQWREEMLQNQPHADPLCEVLEESPEHTMERYIEILKNTGREILVEDLLKRIGKLT